MLYRYFYLCQECHGEICSNRRCNYKFYFFDSMVPQKSYNLLYLISFALIPLSGAIHSRCWHNAIIFFCHFSATGILLSPVTPIAWKNRMTEFDLFPVVLNTTLPPSVYFLSIYSLPFCNSISHPLINIQTCSATLFRMFSCCLKCQFHKESGANREHCL